MSFGVPATPILSGRSQLAAAALKVVAPKAKAVVIPLRFNPAELTIRKTTNFAEIGIPGLDAPLLQWVRGGLEVLSFDALVDTTDTGRDVSTEYVARIRELASRDADLHAPPIVEFQWGKQESFRGVLDGLTTTYLLFDRAGSPLRAKLAISLKRFQSERELATMPKRSPDVDKLYVVRRGDSLRKLAHRVYGDPGLWKVIAAANELNGDVPEPGTRLRIPRLR